ncbi:MAG TPA: DNA repair protein RadC [Thermoanaerobaculia bacterium]|nr:DNA repair protein RadC [Thermoanaerobaculia bacterium]
MARAEPLLRELADDERPRERLLALGGRALSDTELVAVLLGSGRRGASALTLAREVLCMVGGLAGLLGSEPSTLRSPGLGPAKRSSLLAAVEIGRRLARAELPERSPMTRPAAVARYLTLCYRRFDQEVMGALYLDSRHRLLEERELYRGTLNRAAVEPRGILKQALLVGAAAIVLFHTHPSGDPSPSAEDLAFTRRVSEAAEILGLRLIDHLILGIGDRWVSLAERGAW